MNNTHEKQGPPLTRDAEREADNQEVRYNEGRSSNRSFLPDLDMVNSETYVSICQDSSYEHLHSLTLSELVQESGGQVIGEDKEISKIEGES